MNHFLSKNLYEGQILNHYDFKKGQPNSLVLVESLPVEVTASEGMITNFILVLILLFQSSNISCLWQLLVDHHLETNSA
jgi:hypothetical protein